MYGYMKAISRAPGSCGELIQGNIKGRDMLISYPINMYSVATANFGKPKNVASFSKVYKAIDEFLKEIGLTNLFDRIEICIESDIPVGKGMASSTADMIAAVSAVAHLLNYPINEKMLADILIKVEPTDSTVFKELTLFDYIGGIEKENFLDVPRFNVLVLEGFGSIDTINFNKQKKESKKIDHLYDSLKTSLQNKDLKLLGKVSTASAMNNQEILYKPYLNNLINLTEKYNALGVNVAHSGTVCGVIYNDYFDLEKFKWDISQNLNLFQRVYDVQTVSGGFEILE